MGKINVGIFYGKKYNPHNRTFSLEKGENFIEGTGPGSEWQKYQALLLTMVLYSKKINENLIIKMERERKKKPMSRFGGLH